MCTAIPHHYRSPEVEPGRAESQYRYNKGCILLSLITTGARRLNQEGRSHSTGTIKDVYCHPSPLQEPGGGTRKSGVTVQVQ
jgi:hypothetical protein